MSETEAPAAVPTEEPVPETTEEEAPVEETPVEESAPVEEAPPAEEELEDELEVDLDALPKMKVSELKDILKALDLPTSGIKTTLIERIQQHFAEEDKAEAAPEEPEAPPAAEVEAPEKTETPAEEEELLKEETTTPAPVAPAEEFIGLEEKKPVKKIVVAPPEQTKTDEDKKEERAAKFGIVTDKAVEAKKLDRAAKFGIDTPQSLADKKAKRSERFGLAAATNKLAVSSQDKSKDDEKLKKRAARFNMSADAPSPKVIKYDIAEVLKDKIEKTGKTTVDLSSAGLSLEERKKLRALKFGA